jgi:hypothetical protein
MTPTQDYSDMKCRVLERLHALRVKARKQSTLHQDLLREVALSVELQVVLGEVSLGVRRRAAELRRQAEPLAMSDRRRQPLLDEAARCEQLADNPVGLVKEAGASLFSTEIAANILVEFARRPAITAEQLDHGVSSVGETVRNTFQRYGGMALFADVKKQLLLKVAYLDEAKVSRDLYVGDMCGVLARALDKHMAIQPNNPGRLDRAEQMLNRAIECLKVASELLWHFDSGLPEGLAEANRELRLALERHQIDRAADPYGHVDTAARSFMATLQTLAADTARTVKGWRQTQLGP